MLLMGFFMVKLGTTLQMFPETFLSIKIAEGIPIVFNISCDCKEVASRDPVVENDWGHMSDVDECKSWWAAYWR